jgi:hypothetical protein
MITYFIYDISLEHTYWINLNITLIQSIAYATVQRKVIPPTGYSNHQVHVPDHLLLALAPQLGHHGRCHEH